MKKQCLFAGAICAILLANCADSSDGGSEKKEITYQEKPNLKIDGNEIAFSGSVVIPAGSVTGGSSNTISEYEGVFSVEGRRLDIPAFEIGQYEVTQRLYKAVMSGDADSEAEPSYCKDGNATYVYSDENEEEKDLRPVEGVTWYDAVYFCNKLSEKTGKVPYYIITGITRDEISKAITDAKVEKNTAANAEYGYRLPTEAEWEYAARGGNPSGADWNNFFAGKESSSTHSVNEDLDSVGLYRYNSVNGLTGEGTTEPSSGNTGYGTHRVGLKAPVSDSWKLYDMSGNVWEWCWDWYNDIEATTPFDGPSSSSAGNRVKRGGGWGNSAYFCSVSYRGNCFSDYRFNILGIRVVCSIEE